MSFSDFMKGVMKVAGATKNEYDRYENKAADTVKNSSAIKSGYFGFPYRKIYTHTIISNIMRVACSSFGRI